MGLRMMAAALLVAGASALNVGGAGVMQQRTCPAAASRATPTRMQLFGGGRKKPPADEGNIFDVPGQGICREASLELVRSGPFHRSSHAVGPLLLR